MLNIPEIEARVAQTTPGPWIVEPINDGETFQVTTAETTGFVVVCETPYMDDPTYANFIAHARADIPALTSLVRELAGALALHVVAGCWCGKCKASAAVLAKLQL